MSQISASSPVERLERNLKILLPSQRREEAVVRVSTFVLTVTPLSCADAMCSQATLRRCCAEKADHRRRPHSCCRSLCSPAYRLAEAVTPKQAALLLFSSTGQSPGQPPSTQKNRLACLIPAWYLAGNCFSVAGVAERARTGCERRRNSWYSLQPALLYFNKWASLYH